METDISLIEIGGEDDSLLQQFVKDECNNNSNHPHLDLDLNYSTLDFSCSPLQSFRSKRSADPSQILSTKVLNDSGKVEKPSCSSLKGMNNKENLNKNNLGTQSSADEPQQMKRRKKRGGYNLRKSLAWNKAFFTEEGVLNPLELSLLSGSLSKFSGKCLSDIPEEGASLPKGSDLSGDEPDLEAVEENLFNELPKRSLNEAQKVGGGLSSKAETLARQDAAPVLVVSKAPRKVHFAKAVNRSVSQGGAFPRPLGSSSQKRLPNSNMENIRVKDSKLPKFPVSKPESSSVLKSSRINVMGARRSKCNQNIPSVNVEKNRGLKGLTISTKTASDSTSSSAKSFVRCSGKNMARSSSITDITTSPRPPQASKGATGSKVNPDPVLHADIHAPPDDSGCSKSDFSLPQNAHYIGANIRHEKFQSTKPSGLRMPSPSLRLFDQVKASSSSSHNIQSLRNTQSSNLHESSVPKRGNNATETGTIASSSTLKCSIPPIATQALHVTAKPCLDLKNLEVQPRAESNHLKLGDAIDNRELDTSMVYNHCSRVDHCVSRQSGEHAELGKPSPDEVEKIQPKENHMPLMNNSLLDEENRSSEGPSEDNDLDSSTVCPESTDPSGSKRGSSAVLSLAGSAMQLKEGATSDNNMIKRPQAEDSQFESLNGKFLVENHALFSAQFRDAIHNSNPRCITVGDDADEKAREQAVPTETFPEKTSHKNQTPQDNNNILVEKRSFEESLSSNDLGNITDSPESGDSSGSGMRSSDLLHQVITEVQANEGSAGVDNMIKNPQAEYSQFKSSNNNSSVENHDLIADIQFRDAMDNGNLHRCLTDCDHSDDDQTGEKTKPMQSCPDEIGQILHKEDHELQVNDNALLEQSRSSEESQKDNGNLLILQDDRSCPDEIGQILHKEDHELQVNDNTLLEQSRSSEESQKDNGNLLILQDDRSCPDEIGQILHKEDHELQVNDNALLEQSRSSEESQKDNGNLLILQDDRSSEESEDLLEIVTNVILDSSGSKSKSFHVLSQLKPSMQKIGSAGTENTIMQPFVEDVLLETLNINPSVENPEPISNTLFGYAINHGDQCTFGSESLLMSSKDQASGALITCSLEVACSSTETLDLSVQTTSNGSIPQGLGGNGLKKNISSDETEMNPSENSKFPDGELQNGVFPTEDKDSKIISLDDSKQDALVMKCKLNAVPFSDEWLAALEAAGEDILTMKTGTVQNSPPDKTLPEPGPWSPVKRKSNQEIGPFDCTKYTNLPPPDLH